MRKPDYKLFNKMLACVVLFSSVFYMPQLRQNLHIDLDGGYNWIDPPKSDIAASAVELFDSFRLFSIAFILVIVIALVLLRAKMPKKFLPLYAAGLGIFAVGCGAFMVIKGVSSPLTSYIFEQGLCSAALSAIIFLFPEKDK